MTTDMTGRYQGTSLQFHSLGTVPVLAHAYPIGTPALFPVPRSLAHDHAASQVIET